MDTKELTVEIRKQSDKWQLRSMKHDAEGLRIADLVMSNLPTLLDRIEALEDAASELLETADLRGDADLPHPEDDPKLWTARMQTAWEELRRCLTT